jgi:cell division protein FtsN
MAYMQPPMFSRTVLGFVGGLVFGLALAASVALYLTKMPGPFVNKVQRPTEKVNPSAEGKLPDPNAPLYKPGDPGQASAPPTAGTAAPSLPAPAASAPAASGAAPSAAPEDGTRFVLQTGAFRSADDADAMRARLALIGLEAKVFPIEQSGETLYRVRIGPYGHIDDVNRIRARLAENGMESQLVKIR